MCDMYYGDTLPVTVVCPLPVTAVQSTGRSIQHVRLGRDRLLVYAYDSDCFVS